MASELALRGKWALGVGPRARGRQVVGSRQRLVARCRGPHYPLSAMGSRRSLRVDFPGFWFFWSVAALDTLPRLPEPHGWDRGVIGHAVGEFVHLFTACMALVKLS